MVVASIAYGRLVGLASAAVLSVGYGLMLAFSAAHDVDTFGMASFALTVFVLLLVATVAPGVASEPLHLFPSTAAQSKRLLPDASHDRLKTISRFASTLSATGNHERVLDAYLDFMGDLMKEVDGTARPTARMVFLYSDRHELKLSAWRNLDKEDLARAVSDQRGLVGSAIVGAEPVRGKSAADDLDLKPFVSLARARSLLCVPLRAGFDLYGAALLASARPDAFDDEHVELIAAFSTRRLWPCETRGSIRAFRMTGSGSSTRKRRPAAGSLASCTTVPPRRCRPSPCVSTSPRSWSGATRRRPPPS